MPTTYVPEFSYYNGNKKSLSKEHYDKNADYGQKIEPHGEYMNIDSSFKLGSPTEDWEHGTISFKNPLYSFLIIPSK